MRSHHSDLHTGENRQKADTAERNFQHRNLSVGRFRSRSGLEMGPTSTHPVESTGEKIFLPRRSSEPPFAPQQYYYRASKSGVVPPWTISGAVYR